MLIFKYFMVFTFIIMVRSGKPSASGQKIIRFSRMDAFRKQQFSESVPQTEPARKNKLFQTVKV